MAEQNTEIDWQLLSELIRQDNCILVLGPDASPDLTGSHTSLNAFLATTLATDKNITGANIVDAGNLAHVSQQYFANGGSRTRLELKIKELLQPYVQKTTDLHKNLAAVPFRYYVNLGFDPLLRNALLQAGKQPQSSYYNFRATGHELQGPATIEEPVLFNLFGSLDDPRSMIISEENLLQCLVKIITRNPPLQSGIASEFADPENAFLFLGFRFDSWHARVLLHILQTDAHSEPSLGLVNEQAFASAEQQCAAVYFQQSHHFNFSQMSLPVFSSELRKQFTGTAESEKTKPVLTEDAPVVFLCYRRMDKDKVIALEQTLHQANINTWRDEQNLRGGDDWDYVIKDVLNKQADYMLVLQTPNMVSQVKGYCKKEISIALDVQQEFGDFKYLLPAILVECSSFERLARLNTADLTQAGGQQRLIDSIHQDWRKRQALPGEPDAG